MRRALPLSILALALTACGGSEAAKVEDALRDAEAPRLAAYNVSPDTIACQPGDGDDYQCEGRTAEGARAVWASVRRDGDRVYASALRLALP